MFQIACNFDSLLVAAAFAAAIVAVTSAAATWVSLALAAVVSAILAAAFVAVAVAAMVSAAFAAVAVAAMVHSADFEHYYIRKQLSIALLSLRPGVNVNDSCVPARLPGFHYPNVPPHLPAFPVTRPDPARRTLPCPGGHSASREGARRQAPRSGLFTERHPILKVDRPRSTGTLSWTSYGRARTHTDTQRHTQRDTPRHTLTQRQHRNTETQSHRDAEDTDA